MKSGHLPYRRVEGFAFQLQEVQFYHSVDSKQGIGEGECSEAQPPPQVTTTAKAGSPESPHARVGIS